MRQVKDITGQRFGYLTAIRECGQNKHGQNIWLFECKCGNFIELGKSRVMTGKVRSCGCMRGIKFESGKSQGDPESIISAQDRCPFSDCIQCKYTRDRWKVCTKCGWNPKVAEVRMARICS